MFENASGLSVERVRTREMGEYLAIKMPGKRTAYVQNLPECRNVKLRRDDHREPEHRERACELIASIEAAGFHTVYPATDGKFWQRFDKHGKQWGAHRAFIRE